MTREGHLVCVAFHGFCARIEEDHRKHRRRPKKARALENDVLEILCAKRGGRASRVNGDARRLARAFFAETESHYANDDWQEVLDRCVAWLATRENQRRCNE